MHMNPSKVSRLGLVVKNNRLRRVIGNKSKTVVSEWWEYIVVE